MLTKNEENKDMPVILERTFKSSIEKVWPALTDIQQMRQWYFPQLNEFRPERGFETQFDVHHEGTDWLHIWKIAEVAPLRRITIEWKFGGHPGTSVLTFELIPDGKRTKLRLTHSGLRSFMPEKHPSLAQENFIKGWTQFMDEGLKEFLEKD